MLLPGRAVSLSLALLLALCAIPSHAAEPLAIAIHVDARAPWKRRIPVRVALPPLPGPLTLVYPRWLPGMHAVQGPLENIARLAVSADGKPLVWTRDPFDPYLIHMKVPQAVHALEATFDYVPPVRDGNEVFYGVASSHNLAVLNPSAFALAPETDPFTCVTSVQLQLPKGWTAATALTVAPAVGGAPGTLVFSPASLYTVIDSPIVAGAYRKTIPLPVPKGDVPHELDLFGETEEVLKKESVVTPLFARLVAESGRLFGVRHYRSFHYLLALTPEVGRNGLEHHECSLYVLNPQDLDPGKRTSPMDAWIANLIPHEYVHSWCGKFRRPYGEDTHSNSAVQSSDLIWVYEGLTEYLGEVLMVRAGFRAYEDWRRDLMRNLVSLRIGPGRDWESLADAAIAASHTYVYGGGTSLRPINDVYYESAQVWLEADAVIRRESRGMRSLDDFCRLFFGGPNHGAEVRSYTRQDVVDALNRVQPYAWETFIQDRFYGPPKGLPSGGIEAAGWHLSFGDAPADQAAEAERDLRFSLGITVANDGRILQVVPDSLADRAGLTIEMTLLGANDFRYTASHLRDAIRATRDGKTKLDLLVGNGEKYRTLRVDGVAGERFPSFVRDLKSPDLLAAIAAPAVSTTK